MLHLLEAKLHPVSLWTPPVSRSLKDWVRYVLEGERGATGVSMSTYVENETLDHWIGGATAPAPPGTLYFALYTAAPNDDGGGTEVTGGGYARVQKTNNLTNFPASVGGSKSNANDVDFGVASADWGTLTHVGVFDSAGATNLLFWGALEQSRIVNSGDGARFAATKLSFGLD